MLMHPLHTHTAVVEAIYAHSNHAMPSTVARTKRKCAEYVLVHWRQLLLDDMQQAPMNNQLMTCIEAEIRSGLHALSVWCHPVATMARSKHDLFLLHFNMCPAVR